MPIKDWAEKKWKSMKAERYWSSQERKAWEVESKAKARDAYYESRQREMVAKARRSGKQSITPPKTKPVFKSTRQPRVRAPPIGAGPVQRSMMAPGTYAPSNSSYFQMGNYFNPPRKKKTRRTEWL